MPTVQKAARAVGAIVIIGFLSKFLGFVREVVIARYYGATAAMDAYNISLNIPSIIHAGLGTAVATTFIPAFTRRREQSGRAAALLLSRRLFTAFALLGFALCAIGIAFAPVISRLLAPKFTAAQLDLTANLSRILLLTGTFTILNGLCIGLLQAEERFIVPAMAGMPLSLAIMAFVALFARRLGIYALGIGTAAAYVVQVLFQAPWLLRTGFSPRPSLSLRDPDLRRVAVLTLPVFAGTMLLQVNTVLNRIFASGLPEGTISAITYATRVNGLISGIVILSITTVALPALSQAAARKDLPRLRETMVMAVRGLNVLVIPITAGFAVLNRSVIRLLFERGAFDAAATDKTATALLFLSLGLFAYGYRDIFARAFYALQDTATPMINGGITIAANILLLFILVPRYGLAGLCGATSLSGIAGGLLLFIVLRQKLGQAGGREILISLAKVASAALFMGLALRRLHPIAARIAPGAGFMHELLALTGVGVVGAAVYAAGLFLLRAREIEIALGFLRRKPAPAGE